MENETTNQDSRALAELHDSLAKAQAAFEEPKKIKEGQVGNLKFMYAPSPEINRCTRKQLSENGLAYTSHISTRDGVLVVVGVLRHKTGATIESVYPLTPNLSQQARGKDITYGRRYNKTALLDIEAGDPDLDDDGVTAQASNAEKCRDELIELMGAASLGNLAVMSYCEKHAIGKGRTTEDLSVEAVKKLIETWPAASAEMKATKSAPAKKVETKPDPKPETKQEPKPDPKKEQPADDLAGINPKLAELMRRDGITAEKLKTYYVGAKHLPATVEPTKLPDTYIAGLTKPDNWSKVVAKLKS